ncbi:MAG: 2-hydroxyacyl-CoA dehydratase [Peptococcaceae bacterium]|nr:2-hydroxyacyl-CoA dehydratase [Peptococcaceae bacterium]
MYSIGIDVGSTTIKCVVLDENKQVIYKSYHRHLALIKEKIAELITQVKAIFPNEEQWRVSITGSASLGVAEKFQIPFVQEVIALQIAVEEYPEVIDVVIELGGEDAKILFLTNGVELRMNGTCAGGTGAFIDQMAVLLDVTPDEMDLLALKAQRIYPIASRCGVFAKTDVQPLLNQGALKEDVAASIFHAVVNQTIGGLAQGRELKGKIMFLGGPLTFLQGLQKSFKDVLELDESTGIFPENAQYYVAYGAALYAANEQALDINELEQRLLQEEELKQYASTLQPLFKNQQEYTDFQQRHAQADVVRGSLENYEKSVYLGIDAGSTTVKVVLIGQDDELLYTHYAMSNGKPVDIVRQCLQEIYQLNPKLKIAGAAATGYGEELVKNAFKLDYGLVETVAHLTAAQKFMPDVDFIVDIGGQDMKCFKIRHGAIDTIFLNEACSSGCGSFISTFAMALGYSVEEFAQKGLFAQAPVDLGSRCTVFMNSSVKQAQKEGASIEDISAGLSVSVVKNALYKVIRASSKESLGGKIIVQGGTFLNDAILRAFEQEVQGEVVRPVIAGLMGAYGAALYIKGLCLEKSTVLSVEELKDFHHEASERICQLCGNHCRLTVNTFQHERELIAGNRCERPVQQGKEGKLDIPYNAYLYKRKQILLRKSNKGKRGKIGLPLGLNMYENYHFWHPLFTELGYEVVHSPFGSRDLFLGGQSTIPSDTICYPAKLMHGHVINLMEKQNVDKIFYPCMSYNIDENISNNHYNCPVVAYYPEVLAANMQSLQKVKFFREHLGIHEPKAFVQRMSRMFKEERVSKREIKKAADIAYQEQAREMEKLKAYGREAIAFAREHKVPIIVLAGRPYHVDPEINHGIDQLITSYGAVVISEDCLPLAEDKLQVKVLNQWTYHARLYNAAQYICTQPDMYLIQLVSFGCGLDAVTTDEVRDILEQNNQIYTQIKIDEINNLGAVKIRLRSLFAAIEQRNSQK